MCHIGQAAGTIEAVLDLLPPVTSQPMASRVPGPAREGKVVPAALRAKQRGVVIDAGLGGGSVDYTVFEPETISSGMHAVSGNTPGQHFLHGVMCKFLDNGCTLEQRRPRNTNSCPLNGSCPSASCTCRAGPSKPRRMSAVPEARNCERSALAGLA